MIWGENLCHLLTSYLKLLCTKCVNAVENANRVLSTRYDFRGVEAVIELNEKSETVKVTTESDFQLEQLIEILLVRL